MDMFVVRGGTPLQGRVRVGGAKNAALPIMAAALAANGPTLLHDVPNLVDVTTLGQLLVSLGMQVDRHSDGSLSLHSVNEEPCMADYELVRRMRASFCVLGPLLAKRGRACVSLPGGCNIGDRPIDLHLKGLRALGADIRVERGYVIAEADRLRGNSIYLGGPFGSTVTGTCNVMIAAALAEGTTTIEAASCEPEVVDLGNYLNRMGAQITGLGTPFLCIEGVESLQGVEYEIIPDRIEAATLMIAAAITNGRIEIENVRLDQMTAVIEKLTEIGVKVEPGFRDQGSGFRKQETGKSTLRTKPTDGNPWEPRSGFRIQDSEQSQAGKADTVNLHPNSNISPLSTPHSPLATPKSEIRNPQSITISVPHKIQAVDCTALPYPGIPTDLQAQLMALLTQTDGISVVTDKVFPDRFMHAAELVRMGAHIRREGATAVISGVPQLSGACVMASDLRASAALVLAGMAAEGESVIRRIYHLDRGYESLEKKLNQLGADIRRVEDKPENMPNSLQITADETPLPTDQPHILKPPQWSKPAVKSRKPAG